MTLTALVEMKATNDMLERYYQKHVYQQQSISNDRAIEINEDNWEKHLGTMKNYSAYRTFFLRELQALSWQQLLHKYLTRLQTGFSSHAYHPLIRLGYATLSQDEFEIVAALSYLADAYCPIRSLANNQNGLDVKEIIQSLQAENFSHLDLSDGVIAEKMQKANVDKVFQNIAGSLQDCQLKPNDIASLAIILYANTEDFTMLHGVTATHALRLLMPFFAAPQETLILFRLSLLVAYVSIGTPCINFEIKAPESQVAWQSIIKQAVQSYDDHIIKFIYSCHQESMMYSNSLYKYCAIKKLAA